MLCKLCRAERRAKRRAQMNEGTHAYFVVTWRGDGLYKAEPGQRAYWVKSAAERAAELHGNAVVRFLAVCKDDDTAELPNTW